MQIVQIFALVILDGFIAQTSMLFSYSSYNLSVSNLYLNLYLIILIYILLNEFSQPFSNTNPSSSKVLSETFLRNGASRFLS